MPDSEPAGATPIKTRNKQIRANRAKKNEQAPTEADLETWFNIQLSKRSGDLSESIPGRDQNTLDFLKNFNDFVIFEDDHILILNKPHGIASHHSKKYPIGVEEVVKYVRGPQVDLAHRLDRDTTGVLVLTKSEEAFSGLVDQFGNKSQFGMKKLYVAILEGVLKSKTGDEIKAEVSLAPTRSDRMQLAPPGTSKEKINPSTVRSSLTYFRPLAVLKSPAGVYRTLSEVEIVTGRTHQIRVVSSDYLKHPVSGDLLYNPKGTGEIPRPMLHGRELTFQHPVTRQTVTVNAEVPEDFKKFLSVMDWEY